MSLTKVAIIGGGPAGLMAAETAAQRGTVKVDVFDAMPSVGRKLLMAGKGGLNLTHAESYTTFLARYGPHRADLEPLLARFTPDDLRAWARQLGVETFVGSSGRVFPVDMKAAPLLRAWVRRLRAAGVDFHTRHRWTGWYGERSTGLRFQTPAGERRIDTDAVILALGGGSWPQLGSTGAWVAMLRERGIDVAALKPANCGFDVAWSGYFAGRYAGAPVKAVAVTAANADGRIETLRGELMITATGIEGGPVYALSAALRNAVETQGHATLTVDLAPDLSLSRIQAKLAEPRGKRSLANHLRKRLGISGVKMALLREIVPDDDGRDPVRLAAAIKALPIELLAPRPLAEAISSAGGVPFAALDERLMLRAMPGVFCAGEMLDWEAPTGGYLLTACLATGRAAGLGALASLQTGAMANVKLRGERDSDRPA